MVVMINGIIMSNNMSNAALTRVTVLRVENFHTRSSIENIQATRVI